MNGMLLFASAEKGVQSRLDLLSRYGEKVQHDLWKKILLCVRPVEPAILYSKKQKKAK